GRHRDAHERRRRLGARSDVDRRRSRWNAAGADSARPHLGAPAHVPVGRPVRANPLESAVTSGGPGTLYVVSTPIGNMGDFSFRAVEVLRSVDLLLAEDTRHSRVLLDKYDVRTPMASY